MYDVVLCLATGDGISDHASTGTLDGAKAAVRDFRLKHPAAHRIFVRQLLRGPSGRYRVLHHMTVQDGTTALERRARASETMA